MTYISILEAPLDVYSVPDRGDAQSQTRALLSEADARATAKAGIPAGKTNPTLVIPFTATIELGTEGKAVVGAKRAIWVANGLPIPTRATQLFGPTAVSQLKKFQRAHSLAADGELGPETLRALGPFFDQYDFLLYEGYPPGASKEQQARAAMVAYALWGYNHRSEIGYAEYRPMAFMGALEELPVSEDCSTFATKDYKFALVPDPNGMSYDGYGNTDTMRAHGRLIQLAQALPGDLVHYDDPEHVAVYVGSGRVVSHGSEIGPLLLDAGYRPIAEVRTYLDLSMAA